MCMGLFLYLRTRQKNRDMKTISLFIFVAIKVYSSVVSATTSKGISTETSLCNLTVAV